MDKYIEMKKNERTTAVWRNGGCSASYDTFVVGSTFVLRLNFCASKPQLRKAPKRNVSCHFNTDDTLKTT